ncbi:MAG: hypothetical protein KAW12_16925 [Candidatus Aminicenantes bacterium]|nr:hypothetical protein [Candidatus Aminicenantes bacterium]
MKKLFVSLTVVFFALFLLLVSGCDNTPGAPKEELVLLKLVPGEAAGIFCVNVERAAALEITKDWLDSYKKDMEKPKEDKLFENYRDFADNTGIELGRDIRAVSAAFFGKTPIAVDMKAAKDIDMVVLFDLDYDKNKILTVLKEKLLGKKIEYKEETYKDAVVLKIKEGENKEAALSFVNDKTIALGKPGRVKQVIDLSLGEGGSILDQAKIKPFLESAEIGSLISFAFIIPEELKKVHDVARMFSADLTKAEIVFGLADHRGSTWLGEFQLVSPNAEGNAQIASVLNTLLSAAALASPEVGELIGAINISSSADALKLTFSVSDELAKKLQEKALGKKPGLVPPPEK